MYQLLCRNGFRYLHPVHCEKQNLTYLNMGIPLHFSSDIFIRYFLSESWTGEKSPMFSRVREKLHKNGNTLYCLSDYCHYDYSNRCSTKNSLLWLEFLMMLQSILEPLKPLSKHFPPT